MLSFIFLIGGSLHPIVGDIWRAFFRHCPAETQTVVVGNVSAVDMLEADLFVPARWRNARFSVDMLRLMNAGVESAALGATVVFVSATSVPLRPCSEFVEQLENRTTARIAFQMVPPCLKGSQWIALPATVWSAAYTSAMVAGQPLQCRHLAPDETMIHTVLWHDPARVDADTHAIFWPTIPAGGHPHWLTARRFELARDSSCLMARKFDPDRAIYDYDWIKQKARFKSR